MSNAIVKHNFAMSQDMWYDINSGDILTSTSAAKLIKTHARIADVQRKLLALNSMQFDAFRKNFVSHVEKDAVKMVDKWSPDTFALVLKDAISRHKMSKLLDSLAVPNFESDDQTIVMSRDFREVVVTSILKESYKISYISKETRDQAIRARKISFFSQQSSRKGQDRIFQLSIEERIITIVCDGHGTNAVIEYITKMKSQFLALIVEPFPSSNAEALERTSQVFQDFENEMRIKVPAAHSGSTMVFVAHNLKTNSLFIGHIGDSRAVYQQSQTSDIISTEDHKPDDQNERMRIESLGGVITHDKNDVPRVNGNLATSRSFGDESLKSTHGDRTQDLVSVIPFVIGPFSFEEDSVYLLASDGLFDVVSSEEALMTVRNNDHAEVGERLVQMAKTRGSRDDISVAFIVNSE